jgi:hypothetical protein
LNWLWLAADFTGAAYVEGQAAKDNGRADGPVEFQHLGSKKLYTANPCAKTGWYECELPPGAYKITHHGQTKHKTFVAAKQYRLDAPFYDLRLTLEKPPEAKQAVLLIEAQGNGELPLRWSLENLKVETPPTTIPPGGSYRLKCEILDKGRPYYASVMVDNKADEVYEVYGR